MTQETVNQELTPGVAQDSTKPTPQSQPAPAMLHGCCVTKHPGITNPPAKYRVPFQETDDELQKAIMDAIRTWDIGVPEWYEGHTGAMGNHACAIADAVRAILPMWMRRSVE